MKTTPSAPVQLWNVKPDALVYYDEKQLRTLLRDLQQEKARLDKFFDKFLRTANLDDQNQNTGDWRTYKQMFDVYEKVSKLEHVAQYYLNKALAR